MRLHQWVSVVLGAVLLVAGCSLKPKPTTAGLTWNGTELSGASFRERVMEQVTVHYAPPTTPEHAELLGRQISLRLAGPSGLGSEERIQVWILPPGAAWPERLPLPPGRAARAVGSFQILIREEAIDLNRGGGGQEEAGLPQALAVAVRPIAGSLGLLPEWAHEGMGSILVQGWDLFPIRQARFEELMREWVRRFQFKTATTADFIHLAEEVSGEDLTEFFRLQRVAPEDRAPYRPILPLGQMRP